VERAERPRLGSGIWVNLGVMRLLVRLAWVALFFFETASLAACSGGGGGGDDGGGELCAPGERVCVGDEVRECGADGQGYDVLVATCDRSAGEVCGDGECLSACEAAAAAPSNVGCEFWAVDLDHHGYFDDLASAPFGVVLSNAGAGPAHVRIELNAAGQDATPVPELVTELEVAPGGLETIALPTRELDCGAEPNDPAAPGTCLTSNAYRITASRPLVVYQLNLLTSSSSNDASLLLPTSALGERYRVVGWPASHPIPMEFSGDLIVDRSYVTIVGTRPNT
jgi:hypothetical protein